MSEDKRVNFIVNNIASLCQLDDDVDRISKLKSFASKSKEITNFLDDQSLVCLKTTVNDSADAFHFTTKLGVQLTAEDFRGSDKMEILFVKRSNIKEPITPKNIVKCLDIHTLQGSPLLSLFNSLRGVWCPTLLENSETTDKLNVPPKVIQLLADLESSLGSSVQSSGQQSTNIDIENIADVTEPIHEINFWRRVRDDRRSPYRYLAKAVDHEISKSEKFLQLTELSDSIELSAVPEILDESFDTMNYVWSASPQEGSNSNYLFPQKRMSHFFDCVGSLLCRYLQQQLSSEDIWRNSSNNSVRLKLYSAIRIVEKWTDVTKRLTSTFWRGQSASQHSWKGDDYEDTYSNSFKTRLEQVYEILILSDELAQILSSEEKVNFQFEKLFAPLRETKPIHYNPYTEPQWARAKKEYERMVDPVESAVANRFRRNVAPMMDRPQMLLTEFQKYKNLMRRPTIRRALVSERESLLSLLKDAVKKMEASLDRDDNGNYYSDDEGNSSNSKGGAYNASYGTKMVSPVVAGIVYLRQLGSKIGSIYSASKDLLSDLDNYPKFATQCEKLIARVKGEEDTKFDAWLGDLKQRFDDGDESLRLQGSLLAWKDGVLTVNFSEDLVRFLREFRQLDELGFDLPKPSSGSRSKATLADRALEAERYYRYGILLKKTANLYNSLSEQMIDVQEQLLLSSLNSFATLVSRPSSHTKSGDLSWSNPAECESYIKTLQEAAEKLSSENRALRNVHEYLKSQTIVLMDIDLQRQGEIWKAKWRVIKEKMITVKGRYSEKDSKLWILHWDHQIYKTLEVSYQKGLESVNDNLPEIKVELIFKDKALEFKPPIEQIRQNYYKELKKFVNIPYSFEGFGGNGSIYKKMGPRNSKRLVQVYFKAESLFDKLVDIHSRYSEWFKLGQVDLDAYINTHVKTSEDYIVNFKGLKAKRKEIDRLPDQEKVNCCTVSLVPLKNALDELFTKIGDILLVTLRRSLIEEFKEVDQFLESSDERLNSRPKTVEEIGSAKKQWKEIDNRKSTMIIASRNCVEKKKLLAQYAPGTAIDVSDITRRMADLDGEGGRWDKFEIALEAYDNLIEDQKEVLKGSLEEEEVTLNVEIDKFGSRWRQLKPQADGGKPWDNKEAFKIFAALDEWRNQLKELQDKTEKLSEARQTFGMSLPRFEGLEHLYEDIKNTGRSWDLLKEYLEELATMSNEDWLSFSNIYLLQDFAAKWAEKMKASFSRGSFDTVAEYIVTNAERIKKSVPALKYCKSEAFKEDHWTELLQGKLQLSKDLRVDKLKVEHFLSKLDILMDPATLSYVKNLQARALGEVQIREAMQELRGWELSAEVKFLTQEESGRQVPLIKEWKDLFLEIGDKQSLLGSLKESQFFKAFQDVGLALEAKITTLDFVLHTLNAIQRKWVYLEPIFARGALPAEESRFRRVDENFKDIMNTVVKDPKLFYLADDHLFPRISDSLKVMLDQLERCQKALTEFLEAKRSAMPRFYFIGDDDLLEILGQAKNPSVIQSHLKKLFQGIHKVKFDAEFTKITAMISSANEVVELDTPVIVNERVEDWLEQLAVEMRSTLASSLSKCLASKTFDWMYSSQVLCLAQAVKFTDDAEAAIEEGKHSLDLLHIQLKETLREFTSHDLSGEPLMQLKMKSLVFDLVHYIDVVDQIIKKGVSKLTDWQWSKQLRYYMNDKGKCIIRMHDSQFAYSYEYQGNAPKLVHTPLTDRCYLTLTQGMHMGFGGNPYGPAGTGKTESVKALASCMGRQVLVFNCDEALESTSMVRIFIGIVKCGAWGCFDEFNRLKEDQLSAISQQIQIIQDAIKTKTSPINLLGLSVDVDFNAGIFVTLNPAGKGYGGRSRLPDNLKALFRPVAMGAPDNELIAEVSLVTEGFTQSRDLASKIVSLFKLSRQLLSPQQHYDWGLRALKAVLNSGGRLIQTSKVQGITITPEMEYEILIKAVRVNTLSKLTFTDTAKFLALIGDVFPGVMSADITGGELEEAIKQVIKEKPFFLVEDAAQIKKMIQLKESLDQRMGCVVVGPSGCGKSTLWRVLKAAMIKCGKAVVTHVMNPKSMPRERLLGHMDIDTREWADGVLTDAARKVVRESPDVSCWIICDGDVDPEWIESLNSVLDDNHLLTLPNGERISFGPNVNFLFETHDLRFASPATVSRMGMIFLSDEDLDVARIIQRWLTTFPQEKRISLSSWVDELFYKALDWVIRSESTVETTLVGTVMNGLSQIKDSSNRQEFVCGLVRGLGGNLSLAHRTTFAKEVFQWAGERPADFGSPLDCFADASGSFRSFASVAGSANLDSVQLHEVGETTVVPTVSVQRTLATMESWINNLEPFILVGPEGCGKSMMINHAFKRKKNVGIATLHCNAQTTSDDVIKKVSQVCSLYSSPEGRVYRPRECERLVLYLKDINLPRPDMYDTCQLIAFLQQIITFDGFYDSALEFLRLERIQIVASINAATTVGRHPLSTRFTAVVRIGVVDYPETSELVNVFDSFLSVVLRSVDLGETKWALPSERERLANAIVEIYQKTREKFTVDDRRHYLFTPRDMTLLVKNLCRYDLVAENIVEVVAHEASRIFRDRLVGSDACNRFDQQLSSIMRAQFRHTLSSGNAYFTSLSLGRGAAGAAGGGNKKGETKEADPGSASAKDSMGGGLYRMTEEDFKKLVVQGLVYYEREERDLNMLLFTETLEHVAHIDRIISSNSGHILLVGKSGVGRRNAATIVAYMLGYQFYTPAISRDYGPKQFTIDLKVALETAGIKGEQVVVMIEDFQICKESILEIINSLLSSGEVPGMYTHEELEPLLSSLRKLMQEEGVLGTPYEFFVSRVKKYLHVVLCMDPGHPQFLYRCESNPALYAQCTVMWIGEWRTASLKEIPLLLDGIRDFLFADSSPAEEKPAREEKKSEGKRSESKTNRGESKRGGGRSAINEEVEDGAGINGNALSGKGAELVEMLMAIHDSCANSSLLGATPKDYISFLKTWYSLYTLKKQELTRELGHLEAGLFKLDSASEIVNDLRTNAAKQEKELRVAQAAADRAMEEISKAISSSTERRNEVGEVKRTVAENEEKTMQRKKEIENELAEIQPILDSAKHAVGSIKSEHLNEIRSLTAPPEAIADVLAAVLMMLGVQDLSWQSMKKFLSNRGVKEDILNFDARRISADLRKNVAKLLKKKPASFDDASIQRVSIAAAPMAAWVKANIRYSLVMEKIEPLQNELQEEQSKLEISERRLAKCEEELKEIDTRVASLKKEFSARTSEAERLKNNLSIAGSTLDKAEKLIGQLSGEQQRWKVQTGQLRTDLEKLPMKMLLAAGFTTYLAKAPEDVRSAMISKWQEITGVHGFIFKRVMSTESELLQWKSMGLPSDDLSQENSLVIANSTDRVPFIIDPASAATDWLKSILATDRTRPLEVVNHFDGRFMNQVELAVRFGKTLLVLEVDGVEAALYPICRKDLIHQGPRWVVSVGDKTVDYNEGFRMFLVTRNPTPDIPPDAASLVTLVNFTVTRSGLEGQLLGVAIQHEQPELERAKGEMLRKEEDFKVQLAKLEKDLLEALATAEGNLLENTSLIESLSKTKEKSAEIADALLKSADASVKLDEQRNVYRGFAQAGAKLFFLVKALHASCHMYQFSLASFLTLYRQALESGSEGANKGAAKKTEDRLVHLAADVEVRVLYFVGRALFKADRPMFALHLVKGMHPDHFQPKEWEIFTGALVASVTDAVPRGYPQWAPSERKAAFRLLTEQLPHLINALDLENTAKWQRFSSSLEAEKDLPSLRGVTPFQKVLIVQAFRPDRLQSAILQFVTDVLRIDSVSPPPLSLATLHSESSSQTPLLFISSPGADPSKELQEFAAKTIGLGNYEELAMGGGQQEIAQNLLRNAAANGTWLCLKNLHLVVAWLPTLEKELSSVEPHGDFRLFLTSEAHPGFTSILLQQSLKATFESPPGIKKNLQRTFDSWDPDFFDAGGGSAAANAVRAKLLFLLACFQAVIQERRTYIPQGWTKFYEFSYGDMKAGTYVLEAVTANKGKQTKMDWETIHGLMEDAIFGGRIDNAFDLRVLRAYLSVFFCDRLASDSSSGAEVMSGTPLRMPSNADYKSFRKIIAQLPDTDAPYIFSLPDNIERSLQRNNSAQLIKQLRLLSASDTEGNKYDREKWRAQLGPVLELWQQLTSSTPGLINRKANTTSSVSKPVAGASGGSSNKKVVDPVEDFVNMEYEAAGDICATVDFSLQSLKKVLFGSGLLTPAIQSSATALLSGAVPADWLKLWDSGPEKPQAWLRELVRKRVALVKWKGLLGKGAGSTNLLSSPLALGDLFKPATFINALRQQTARLLNTAIDLVKMVCVWDQGGGNSSKRMQADCPLPCTLSAMLLQGATFHSGALQESSPEASELTTTPEVTIGFVPLKCGDMYEASRSVTVPVYQTVSREDFLTELQMPLSAEGDQGRWILAGVALFLNEDD